MITVTLQGGAIGVKMDKKGFRKELTVVGLMLILLVMLPEMSHASVVLIGNNKSFTFDDLEANFVLATKGSGLCGMLQIAEPSDGCSALRNKAVSGEGLDSPFALIERGKCSFESKIRNAQSAGFKAAIVYDNEDGNTLVANNTFEAPLSTEHIKTRKSDIAVRNPWSMGIILIAIPTIFW